MIKSLLVALGGPTFSKSATDHAVEIATRHEAFVVGVAPFDPASIWSGPVPLGAGGAAQELREHRLEVTRAIIDDSIDYFQAACSSANLTHCVHQVEGKVVDAIIDRARYSDLLIGGVRHLVTKDGTEVSRDLIRLIEEGVRPALAVVDEVRPVERVLIAYSGSTESAKTMKQFVQLKIWDNLELRIVTFEHDQIRGEERLGEAAAYCRLHGFDPSVEVVDDKASEGLLPYASGWNADLVVMGNSRRTYLARRIFGETTLQVLAHATRPLFLSQ